MTNGRAASGRLPPRRGPSVHLRPLALGTNVPRRCGRFANRRDKRALSPSSSESVIIKQPLPTSPKQRRYWNAPHGSALALALADTGRAHAGLVVAVARDTHAAHALEAELGVFAGGRSRRAAFPGLGNAALRSFRAASGYRLAAHRDAVSVAVGQARRAGRAGRDADAAAGAEELHRRLRPRARAAAETRSGHRAAPAGNLRLPARAAGRRARRLRRARRADRHLPDGQRRAVSHRALRRGNRIDPHVRSGNAALGCEGRRGAPAARARVSADRRIDEGIPQHAARALSDRSAPLSAVSGHPRRRDAGRHRILPAAVLRTHRHAVRLSRRQCAVRARRRRARSRRAVLVAGERTLRAARARRRTADPAGGRAVPAAAAIARTA